MPDQKYGINDLLSPKTNAEADEQARAVEEVRQVIDHKTYPMDGDISYEEARADQEFTVSFRDLTYWLNVLRTTPTNVPNTNFIDDAIREIEATLGIER